MSQKIAIFGGSFNPPGKHHRRIVQQLTDSLDRQIVVPCGPRPDKAATNDVEPVHRAAMCDLAFQGIRNTEVDLFDLEHETFTRTQDLDKRYQDEGEVWHVVGADLVKGGKDGQSPIQRDWRCGEELWRELRFAVIPRQGYPILPEDLPPKHQVFQPEMSGASEEIRGQIFKHQSFEGLVTSEVAAYIKRHNLYSGRIPSKVNRYSVSTERKPETLVLVDDKNPRAKELAKSFSQISHRKNPDLIIVIGGDGFMLHAIREHWRKRVPFLGVNAGHRGFLLNEAEEVLYGNHPLGKNLVRHLPLLYVETQTTDRSTKRALAFNDAWLERAGSQSAWLEVEVDGQMRIPKLMGDGALISTAAGSTAYARAMGATPLLTGSQAMLLVGSNVLEPPGWKSAHLSLDSVVEIGVLDSKKRRVRALVDGVDQGEVEAMTVRVSRIAAVELMFLPDHDMATKLAKIQFP